MKLSRIVTPALVVLVTAAAAIAAEDVHAAHDPVGAIPTAKQGLATGITAIVVFLLVAAFLQAVVWPKISKGLEDRENKIRTEIEAAEMAQQQARAALQQYEKNLAEARAEAARMLEQARTQQQAIAAELRAKAEAELTEMRERAKRDIESAKRAALAEVYDQAANVATDVARKILQREISAADQQRLVTESLSQLQGVGRA